MSGINLKNPSGGSVSLVPEDGVGNVTATVRHDDGVLASEAHADFVAGVGRTWQNVTASRSAGVTYTNNTGRDIEVSITHRTSSGLNAISLIVNGATRSQFLNRFESQFFQLGTVSCLVPSGGTYYALKSGTTDSIGWMELR